MLVDTSEDAKYEYVLGLIFVVNTAFLSVLDLGSVKMEGYIQLHVQIKRRVKSEQNHT